MSSLLPDADEGDEDGIESPVEPGSPTPEGVAFVLLGVLSTIGVILHLATLVGG